VPETRLPFTYIVKGRYWRFRRGDLKASLPGQPRDPAFHKRYGELVALSENKPSEPDRARLSWLIGEYRKSAEFHALRPLTQLDYGKVLTTVESELGDEPFEFITPKMVKAVRDDLAKLTPRKAHKVKALISLLFTWAQGNDHVSLGFNPAAPIRKLKVRAKAYTAWSEPEILVALGTAPAWLKTPLLLALYTGQRREDIVTMDWEDFQGSIIRVKQSKTGEPLVLACHRDLRVHLESIRTSFGGKIARTAKGRPFTANSLSQALRRFIAATGCIPADRGIHGLRYSAAARLDAAGCSVTEAVAVMGHRTYQMALKYMDQRRASEAAMAKQEARDEP
jgi:integrase